MLYALIQICAYLTQVAYTAVQDACFEEGVLCSQNRAQTGGVLRAKSILLNAVQWVALKRLVVS